MTEPVNHGVIPGRQPSDYVAGEAASVIEYTINNPSGDYEEDLPTGERQFGRGGDKMNCVTQSWDNSIETQLNRMIRFKLLPPSAWAFLRDNGYLDSNGKVNLNDRIPSILNGTTPAGNYLWQVADVYRSIGIFPHGILPDDPNLTWSEYYNRNLITPAMLALGQESLKHFSFPFEWVPVTRPSFEFHLKQAPLQVVKPGHAIEGYKTIVDIAGYFDTYEPYKKTIGINQLTDAMKIVVVPKGSKKMNQTKVVLGKDGKTVWICTPCSKMEVLKERASVEGFELPSEIPPASSL